MRSSFLVWSHFLRRTGTHFVGKCSKLIGSYGLFVGAFAGLAGDGSTRRPRGAHRIAVGFIHCARDEKELKAIAADFFNTETSAGWVGIVDGA